MATLRALAVAFTVIVVTIAILPLHCLARWRRWPMRKTTARTWHRAIARVLGLRVRLHGHPPRRDEPGVLLAVNHVSWLDIVALGSVAEVSFIAKDEIDGWPFFGTLARLQDSVFIARDARTTTRDQATRIAERLARGDHLVLFAEGTTSHGNFVLPFKSALFGAAGLGLDTPARVQPAAIVYTGIAAIPMGRRDRPIAAWPGNVALGPHLWRVLQEGRIDVAVAFGAPIDDISDRKHVARQAEAQVRIMTSALLRGRDPAFVAGENAVKARP